MTRHWKQKQKKRTAVGRTMTYMYYTQRDSQVTSLNSLQSCTFCRRYWTPPPIGCLGSGVPGSVLSSHLCKHERDLWNKTRSCYWLGLESIAFYRCTLCIIQVNAQTIDLCQKAANQSMAGLSNQCQSITCLRLLGGICQSNTIRITPRQTEWWQLTMFRM